MSARLIAGQPNNPTFVKAAELEKYPQGPLVGIVALPRRCPSVRRRPGLDRVRHRTDTDVDDLGRPEPGGHGDAGQLTLWPALSAAADARCHLGRRRSDPCDLGGHRSEIDPSAIRSL